MASNAPLREGDTLLHYRIGSRLGEGGMGVVFRAEDTRLGRPVALKVLREELAADADWSRRFEREMRVASSFSHPGIATLYDVHREGDLVFYTMELVEGRSLRQKLAAGPLPLPDLLRIAVQVAEALAEAHRKGIVHRDMKPENVVESASGWCKVLDFGLARVLPGESGPAGGASRLETISFDTSREGRIIGTIAYMSPEQAQGSPAGVRSDVFSLGSVLYELAAGKGPFARHDAISTFHAIVHEEPRPLRAVRPDLPRELEWIVARCLAKNPEERYPDCGALAADLRSLLQETSSGARRRIRPFRAGARAGGRRRWALAIGASAVVVLLIVVARQVAGPGGSGNGGGLSPGGALKLPTPPPLPASPPAGTGNPAAASPAAGAVPAEASGSYVAVAPFSNVTGDPNLAWMGEGIPEMLTTGFAGGGGIQVLSTQRLKDLIAIAQRDRPAALDAATTSEIARYAGARLLVGGSVFRMGAGYRIDAQVYDTATGQVVHAARVEGKDVFEMADRLTADLRRGLNLTATEVAARQVGTGSEEAYRRYSEGLRDYQALRYPEAEAAFRRSLQADPGFVPAQARLGMSLYLDGKKEEGLRWVETAASAGDRLPARERLLVGIVTAFHKHGNAGLGIAKAEEFSAAFPRDPEGRFWAAISLGDAAGDQLGAVRMLTRVVAEEPENLPAVAALASRLAEVGSAADAAKILFDFVTRHPEAVAQLARRMETYQAAAGKNVD